MSPKTPPIPTPTSTRPPLNATQTPTNVNPTATQRHPNPHQRPPDRHPTPPNPHPHPPTLTRHQNVHPHPVRVKPGFCGTVSGAPGMHHPWTCRHTIGGWHVCTEKRWPYWYVHRCGWMVSTLKHPIPAHVTQRHRVNVTQNPLNQTQSSEMCKGYA